jgi:signal transduction histidine kinase
VAELEVRLAEQGRDVGLDAAESIRALGDPGSVARIVRILLDNALRHTPARGGVRAETILRPGAVGIAIEDDGPGVAAADRERVFERFARGERAEPGGVGLGLAIARELARQMGGDLLIEETRAGARFVLWLPPAGPA